MWHCAVKVKDLSGNMHSVYPSTLEAGDALELNLELDAADTFTFQIQDFANAVRAWLVRGCIVCIYIDSFAPPTTLRFMGMVEGVKESWTNPTAIMVEVSGRDVFNIMLDRRVTATYLNTEASEIVRDLCHAYLPYSNDTVLAMSFYEGTGNTAHDESIYGNNGTISGASWVDGKYGKALSFDGTDDYVSLGTAVSSSARTLSLWFKLTELASMHTHDLYLTNGLYFKSSDDKIYIAGTSDYFNVAPTAGAWHHLVLAFADKADSSTADLYIDGTKYDCVQGGGAHAMPDLTHIGYTSNSFYGIIDEVRVWDKSLPSDDISPLYAYNYLHDIDATSTIPDDIRFPYRPLKEALDDLAGISGFAYHGNPNNVITWKEAILESSGISYGTSDISTDAVKESSLYPIRNRVYVLGGEYMELDQSQTDYSGTPSNTKDYWYAQSFIPTRASLDQITLYLKRTGAPENLEVEIRKGDSSPGEKICSMVVDAGFIKASASWIPIKTDAVVFISEKYWIVIKKNGDASNYYEWFNDGGNTGESAYSDDGTTWTVSSSAIRYAFKTHFAVPVLAVKQDYASGGNYLWREEVYEDKAIISMDVARSIAKAKLEELKDETPTLNELRTLGQSLIPDRGKTVSVTLTPLNIVNEAYEVQKVSFRFRSGEIGTQAMNVQLGRSAEELAEWLASLKSEVNRTKIGNSGIIGGVVNTITAISETVAVTESVSTTEATSGEFEIDSAEIDFSDVG